MIEEYLENLYQELYEKKINLEQETQKRETDLDNNIRFIETLKNSLDEDFELFTPRNVDEENHKKIESLMEEQEIIKNEIHQLQLEIIKYNTKIRELELVIEDFRRNQGYTVVPSNSNDFSTEQDINDNTEKKYFSTIMDEIRPKLRLLEHKVEICKNLSTVDAVRTKLELQKLEKDIQNIISIINDSQVDVIGNSED